MQNDSMEKKSWSALSHILLKGVAYTNKVRILNWKCKVEKILQKKKKEQNYQQAGVETQYICTLQFLSQLDVH